MSGIAIRGARTLLTGASSGIGRATAVRLAAQGAHLAIAARREALLHELADAVADAGHARPAVLVADLSRPGAAHRLAAEAVSVLGDVDILINNAGGGVGGMQWSVGDGEPAREAFEVNHWSPLALIQELVPRMRQRGRGAVVNVTSLAQVTAWPDFGAYAATKAACAVATQTLQTELADSGVLVVEVLPGPVDTAVQGETRLLPGIERMLNRMPLGDPDVMAARIVRALQRGEHLVVYPGRARLVYWLPGVARWYGRRLAVRTWRSLDTATRDGLMSMVVRSGSMGEAIAREARESWERGRAAGRERSSVTRAIGGL